MPRRTLVFLVCLCAALLGLLAWASWRHRQDDDARWQRIEAWVAEHRGHLRSGRILRDPFHADVDLRAGEVPGDDAFAHYRAAGLAAERLPEDVDALRTYTPLDPVAAVVVGRWRPVLDELAAGARRAVVVLPTIAELVDERWGIDALEAHRVGQAALLDLRVLQAEGRPAAALLRFLDIATLATDLRSSGLAVHDMVATQLALAAVELLDDAVLRALPPVDLRALSQAAERLEADAFDEGMIAWDVVYYTLARGELLRSGAVADSSLLSDWLLARIAAIDRLGAMPDRRERARLYAALDDAADPWSGAPLPVSRYASLAAERARLVARLRMLRIAVAFHLGEALPRLVDPGGSGGAPFATTVRGDELEIVGHAMGESVEPRRTSRR